jgi:hypothetical protein
MGKEKRKRKLASNQKVMRRMKAICMAKCAMIAAAASSTVAAIQAARVVKTDPGGAIATLGEAIEDNVKVANTANFDIKSSLKWLKERGLECY